MRIGIGKLQEAQADMIYAACRRFGAEKVERVLTTAEREQSRGATDAQIISSIEREAGLTLGANDLSFTRRVVEACSLIETASQMLRSATLLQEAPRG